MESMVVSEDVVMEVKVLEDGCIIASIPACPGVYDYAYPGAVRLDGTVESEAEARQRAMDGCCDVLREWKQLDV